MPDRMNRAARMAVVSGIVLCAAACAAVPVSSPTAVTRVPSPSIPLSRGSSYLVRSGDTWWGIARAYGLQPQSLAAANRMPPAATLQVGQKLFIPLPSESRQFYWPLRGTVSAAGTKSIRIGAAPGSYVRASRTGRVAVATAHLSGWGKTVILDHLDGYLSIYAGLDQVFVQPGAAIPQGSPIGSIGAEALHFEIRHEASPKSALALLPPA